ncbi:MAG: DUF2809 domain-containing protein [Myxococcota bacterium]
MRLRWLAASVVVVALGLGSRATPLPDGVGDALYAVLIYTLTGVVAPRARGRAAFALATCWAIEASQLAPWLAPIRATRLGALVLGRGFLWSDLAWYTLGVGIAAGAARYREHAGVVPSSHSISQSDASP